MKIKNRLKFVRKMTDAWRGGGESKRIVSELLAHANPREDLHDRMMWLVQIIRWLKKDLDRERTEVRFRFMFQLLEQNPEWKRATQKTLRSILTECSFLRVFQQTGFTTEHGLWTEVIDRLLRRIFPHPKENDFYEVIIQAFDQEGDDIWIAGLSDDILRRIEALVCDPVESEKTQESKTSQKPAQDATKSKAMPEDCQHVWNSAKQSSIDAMLVLASTVAHLGLSTEVFQRRRQSSVSMSWFVRLQYLLQQLLVHSESNQRSPVDVSEDDISKIFRAVEECRCDVRSVYQSMDETGVSSALVYKLETILSSLTQIEHLVDLYRPAPEWQRAFKARHLVVRSVSICLAKQSARDHLQKHLYLLSRKISERNGYSGEHYISRTRSEIKELFLSAIGCGVVVVFMTIFKILLLRANLAPLFQAIGIWVIYSSGFLTMQFFGYTLATKLPSFTASHLAHKLSDMKKVGQLSEFSFEIRDMFRSQWVALGGNVFGLIPVVLLISWAFHSAFGFTVIKAEDARRSLEALNPIYGLVVPLGALTGLQLWVSSLCGGWFENWIVFKGIPDAIADHPQLKKAVGKKGARNFATWFLKNSSGLATNVSLGFLFGFVPLLGVFLGLYMDGKHVTISSAESLFALFALSPESLTTGLFIGAAIGLALIGLTNFSVSFAMALFVAARACNVKRKWLWFVFVAALRGGKRRKKRKAAAKAANSATT